MLVALIAHRNHFFIFANKINFETYVKFVQHSSLVIVAERFMKLLKVLGGLLKVPEVVVLKNYSE